MQSYGTTDRSAVTPQAAPLFARLLSKLVLEVLPASLASVIGAVLLAHYQFGHPSVSAAGTATPLPASPEMLQLVRDEHDLIRNFLNAQQAAQAGRYATADVAADAAADVPSAKDATDAELIAAALRRTANAAPAKASAPHAKVAAVASAPQAIAPAPAAAIPAAPLPAVAPAPQELSGVAGLQNSAPPPPAPESRSLVARILTVKDHVVSAPLHAVKAIGGIPSWIGHRLGSEEPDPSERMFSAAS